jgi:hypothetical protein
MGNSFKGYPPTVNINGPPTPKPVLSEEQKKERVASLRGKIEVIEERIQVSLEKAERMRALREGMVEQRLVEHDVTSLAEEKCARAERAALAKVEDLRKRIEMARSKLGDLED